MDDSQLWRVEPVPADRFATGGYVSPGGGQLVAIFGGCVLPMPKRLAEIVRDPFAKED